VYYSFCYWSRCALESGGREGGGKKGTVVATAGREIVVSSGGSLLRQNHVLASPCAHELPRDEEVQNASLQRTPLPVPEQLLQ